jgi:hypothetical protein
MIRAVGALTGNGTAREGGNINRQREMREDEVNQMPTKMACGVPASRRKSRPAPKACLPHTAATAGLDAVPTNHGIGDGGGFGNATKSWLGSPATPLTGIGAAKAGDSEGKTGVEVGGVWGLA